MPLGKKNKLGKFNQRNRKKNNKKKPGSKIKAKKILSAEIKALLTKTYFLFVVKIIVIDWV